MCCLNKLREKIIIKKQHLAILDVMYRPLLEKMYPLERTQSQQSQLIMSDTPTNFGGTCRRVG